MARKPRCPKGKHWRKGHYSGNHYTGNPNGSSQWRKGRCVRNPMRR